MRQHQPHAQPHPQQNRAQPIPKNLQFNQPPKPQIRPQFKNCKRKEWRKLQICPKTKQAKFNVKNEYFYLNRE